MEEISFEEFKKMDLRIGKVLSVERLPRTNKLYRLSVDVGMEKPVQIVTGLVPYYKEEELKDREIVVIVNLKPAKLSGEMSYGMLLCAEKDGSVVILGPEKAIGAGAQVR